MDYQAFSIRLAALLFPEIPEDAESRALLGEESLHLLRTLWRSLREKLIASSHAFRTAELLEGSIFGCCLPEGMAFLRCTVLPVEREVTLDGFLVTRDTLRTAWQLSRWKLLLVCAAGWDRRGITEFSDDEADRIAMSLQATREQQAKLLEMSRQILASPIPFSFAMTSYPVQELPVRFPGAALENLTQAALSRGAILFSGEQAAALAARYRQDISVLQSLRLCCAGKKQYQTLRMQHILPFEDSREMRSILREETAQYPSEELWYFSVQVTQEQAFLRGLRVSVSEKLCAGTADFAEVSAEAEHFIEEVYRIAERLRQHTPPPQKPDTEGGGFLRSLFSRRS